MNITYKTFVLLLCAMLLSACASNKKRGDGKPSKLNQFYHNTTAYYNGYFNANELLEESYLALEEAHVDNYTDIISVYNYDQAAAPKIVNADLDKAIEKVVKVAKLHENSTWIDDCYVLMGEAQYIKQDYETAEETLLYFQEEFNPNNPNGRNFAEAKLSTKEKKKIKEEERELERKKKEAEKKAREEQREAEKKARERERKEQEKAREAERKARKKQRELERNQRKKARKKGKSRGKKERSTKERTKSDQSEEGKDKTVDSDPQPISSEDPKSDLKVEEDKVEDEVYDIEKRETKKKVPNKDQQKAYQKGQLLLAKTLVERDNNSSALYLLDKLEREGVIEGEVRREIPVVRADIHIKDKSYASAIEDLNQAIELGKKKDLKARYAFILGQLHQQQGDYSNAATYFAQAKNWAKDYKMEFAAKLQTEKNGMLSGSKSREDVDSKLGKMLKEDKYIEQRDQIYFVKGEINLEENNFNEARDNFSKSIQNNVANPSLKIETYLKLGDLYYAIPEYREAKNYYDSTLTLMDAKHTKYLKTKHLADNLTDIAKNLDIVEVNDSLLRMTKLSNTELKKIAEDRLRNQDSNNSKSGIKKDTEKNGVKKSGIYTSTKSVFGKSDFPFYDALTRERAKQAFEKKWGDRPLVDNWRRGADIEGIFVDESSGEIVQDEDEIGDEEIEAALRELKSELPFSATVRNRVNSKLESAYFTLGKLFRTKIEDYQASIDALETLVRKYPNSIHKLEAYYYLYLNHVSLGNKSTATQYKNRILEEYPESNYAKVIKDPSYAESLRENDFQLEQYYEETYRLFNEGKYKDVIARVKQSDVKYGKQNDLHRKFELLRTMSVGSTKGRDLYVNGLRNFIQKYPNTEEQTKAAELLRLLSGEDVQLDVKAADDVYKVGDDEIHYIAVILYNAQGRASNKVSTSISDFNKKYFKTKRLRISDIGLNMDTNDEMVFVRTFKGKEEAMDYYNVVMESPEEYVGTNQKNYKIYVVSQSNYRRLLQDKSDKRYAPFFEKNYLAN